MPRSTDAFRAKILIVDDQESNLRLLEYALSRAGYVAVSSTIDPLEACALHRRNRYDLILLDLQMPRMNGFEVLEALRNVEGEKVAVLVMTADPSQMVRALEGGARSFLSKPFHLAEVLQRVHLLLDTAVSRELDEPKLLVVPPGTAASRGVAVPAAPVFRATPLDLGV